MEEQHFETSSAYHFLLGHVALIQKEQLVLVQWLRGNRLGSWTFGKARSPAGDVIGHAELQVRLAEGSHNAVVSGRNKKITHICQKKWATYRRPSCPSLVSSSSPHSRGLLLLLP